MKSERCSGVLLHPTSLPGPTGIGELGREAFAFVDWLQQAGQKRWQVLPLGPTGYADSPYASFSSFAGNPMLISLARLVDTGDLDRSLLEPAPASDPRRVDFGQVIAWKQPLLQRAAEFFLREATAARRQEFRSFCQREAHWLDDFAIFMAVKQEFQQRADRAGVEVCTWNTYWDRDIAWREPAAMARWADACGPAIEVQKALQFLFFDQWLALRRYANERSVRIIGDLPIFVAGDSADVWAAPDLFLLEQDGTPSFVAGVPPDYFAKDGQNWGNPQYNWPRMEQDRFRWWIRRVAGTAALVDWIRIDHFRGFEKSYFIPGRETTGRNGVWTPVPGQSLFRTLREELGQLPVIAEDLGEITPEVDRLRDESGFPGMRILQFAFDSGEDRSQIFLPHNHIANCVVYTGTHDNDTVVGWYQSRTPAEQQVVAEYIGHPLQDVAADFVRLALSSVADTVIIPMQDLLGLDQSARMNTPGTRSGNWSWRMEPNQLRAESADRLGRLARIYGR